MQLETSAKSHFVILSEAKDLVFSRIYEILRSLTSLRMTSEGAFAEVSTWYQNWKRAVTTIIRVKMIIILTVTQAIRLKVRVLT